MSKAKLTLRFKGGPGSGHRGHAGRPGKRGGSSPGGGGASPEQVHNKRTEVLRNDVARYLGDEWNEDSESFTTIRGPEGVNLYIGWTPRFAAYEDEDRLRVVVDAAVPGMDIFKWPRVSVAYRRGSEAVARAVREKLLPKVI